MIALFLLNWQCVLTKNDSHIKIVKNEGIICRGELDVIQNCKRGIYNIKDYILSCLICFISSVKRTILHVPKYPKPHIGLQESTKCWQESRCLTCFLASRNQKPEKKSDIELGGASQPRDWGIRCPVPEARASRIWAAKPSSLRERVDQEYVQEGTASLEASLMTTAAKRPPGARLRHGRSKTLTTSSATERPLGDESSSGSYYGTNDCEQEEPKLWTTERVLNEQG